jgi:tetratricopeptide (TPR) repeat protein
MLSADYRAALAAEASGNVEAAAERYGLAGDREGAVRMHLARAQRAGDRNAEIAALRDALHWAGDDPPLRRMAAGALGRSLHARAEAEGVATARDRERLREAAAMLVAGGEYRLAGEIHEKLGDYTAAAGAYSAGGLIERVEEALGHDDERHRKERERRDAYAGYETQMRVGRRDDARAELLRCIQAATDAGDYRRLLDDLESRLLTGGRVELRRRQGRPVIACGAPLIAIGRDALCDLPLRTGGISRRHAEIEVSGGGHFALRDAGSRNGTALAGLPIAGKVPLSDTGSFDLGDDTRIDFRIADHVLVLTVASGLDRGATLLAAAEGEVVDLGPAGIGGDVLFQRGRPWLSTGASGTLTLGGEPIRHGRVQLVRGDRVVVDGEELEVA